MKKECDSYPNFNHEACALNQYEIAVATYFEHCGLVVERLCTSYLSNAQSSPDFRVFKESECLFLCEVMHVVSSTAALSEADWRYENAQEYKRLIAASKELSVSLVAFPDQIALWKGNIPYPAEGKNTKQREKEYEQKVKDALSRTPAAFYPLRVTLHRHDPFIWGDDEIQQFVFDIAEKLALIIDSQTPRDWCCYGGPLYVGHYRQPRDHGRFIKNSIEVRRQGNCLELNSISYLGINWSRIEKRCHDAQIQIRDRLDRDHRAQNIARAVMIFIEEDLLFEYYPRFDELKGHVKRHIQAKSPELSAVVFCSDQRLPNLVNSQFVIFRVAHGNTPVLGRDVFKNGDAVQIDL